MFFNSFPTEARVLYKRRLSRHLWKLPGGQQSTRAAYIKALRMGRLSFATQRWTMRRPRRRDRKNAPNQTSKFLFHFVRAVTLKSLRLHAALIPLKRSSPRSQSNTRFVCQFVRRITNPFYLPKRETTDIYLKWVSNFR